LGNLEDDTSTGDFERWMKGALGMELLSLKRLHGGGLEGELLHWGLWKIFHDGLQRRASLSLGTLSSRGEPGIRRGCSYNKDFDR